MRYPAQVPSARVPLSPDLPGRLLVTASQTTDAMRLLAERTLPAVDAPSQWAARHGRTASARAGLLASTIHGGEVLTSSVLMVGAVAAAMFLSSLILGNGPMSSTTFAGLDATAAQSTSFLARGGPAKVEGTAVRTTVTAVVEAAPLVPPSVSAATPVIVSLAPGDAAGEASPVVAPPPPAVALALPPHDDDGRGDGDDDHRNRDRERRGDGEGRGDGDDGRRGDDDRRGDDEGRSGGGEGGGDDDRRGDDDDRWGSGDGGDDDDDDDDDD